VRGSRQGREFKVKLPIADAEPIVSHLRRQEPPLKRVLIADDSRAAAHSLALLLLASGP
jgi:hypothetical protein